MNTNKQTEISLEMLITLLQGGTTLSESLRVLCGEGIPAFVRRNAMILLDAMREGCGLSSAFSRIGKIPGTGLRFSKIHISLISAAEVTGSLLPVLLDINDDLNRRSKARETFLSAMIYPSLVILIAFIGTILLYVKGIPLFIQNGMISESVMDSVFWGLLVAIGFLFLAGIFIVLFFNHVFNGESCEYTIFYSLSFLLRRGISLPDAITQCVSGIMNDKAKRALFAIKRNLCEGVLLSKSFQNTGFFDPFVTGWIGIADDNGNAISIFEKITEYYRQKDDKFRAAIARMIEPCIIVIAGIYLLILTQTIIMPILTYSGGFHA